LYSEDQTRYWPPTPGLFPTQRFVKQNLNWFATLRADGGPLKTRLTRPRLLARIAGGLYLINIVGGAFAIGYVPAVLIVAGDAAATARNIHVNEQLYRSGIVAHVLITLTNIPLAVIFYDLFKVVDRRIALLVVFFTLVGTAVEAAILASMPVDLTGTGYAISSVYFGCYGLALGYLVFRSTFLPRAIGVLLAFGAASYLTYSFASLLSPDFAARLVPYVQLPSLIGEGSLCLTLLLVGVNAQRWSELAQASGAHSTS
jgi:hypothetical protein